MTFYEWIFSIFRTPVWQEPTGTNQFFDWYYYGLSGMGGWFIFLLLAVIAVMWLFYDSQKRRLPAIGWRLAIIVMLLLLLPTIAFRFTVKPDDFRVYQNIKALGDACTVELIIAGFPNLPMQGGFTSCDQLLRALPPLTAHGELIFYLGLLGGVLAPVLAAGYYITFQGMVGCNNGHVYEAVLGRCPECATPPPVVVGGITPPVGGGFIPGSAGPRLGGGSGHVSPPPKPAKPTVQYAWLVDLSNNRRFDLCEGTTYIGRSAEKTDIVLTDPAVSRLHAQIREAHGHFTLSDLDSSSGTLLNGRRIRVPQVLQNGDRITLGDTVLQFVTVH